MRFFSEAEICSLLLAVQWASCWSVRELPDLFDQDARCCAYRHPGARSWLTEQQAMDQDNQPLVYDSIVDEE